MISLLRRRPPAPAPVDPRAFREAMSRPAVARELFLPLDRAWWDGGRFTLGRRAGAAPRPALRGVRLHEPAPAGSGPPPERDTQADLGALVASVTELRKAPGLAGLVLSDETMIGRGGGAVPGKRIVFGLSSPPGGRFVPDDAAAAECHRVLRRGVNRAGYRIEHPKEPPDLARGFAGLRDWAGAVRLRRRRTEYRWLLLLPLLLVPLSCVGPWRVWPGADDRDGAPKSAGKGGAGDGDKVAKGGGGPSAPPRSGGGDGKDGKGNSQGGGGQPPPGPQQATGEEAGPRTTIPSKIAKPTPYVLPAPPPNIPGQYHGAH